MPIRPFLLLVLCICLLQGLFAQPASVHFTRVDINNGLSNNQVNTIFRDKTGFVWIGTMNGLNRYDGYGCKIFRSQSNDTNSLVDNYIHRIYPFPGNRLLLNTRQGFNIYDPVTERFDRNITRQYRLLSLPDTALEKVHLDRKGNYWFLFSGKGLWRYTTKGETHHYGQKNARHPVLYANLISDMAEGPDGMIWLIYHNGSLDKLDPITNRVVEHYAAVFNIPNGSNGLYNLFVGSKNHIWITRRNGAEGIYRFEPANRVVKHLQKESAENPLRSNIITGVTEDKQGNTWIATDHGGLQIIYNKTGAIQYLENNVEDNRSLSQNSLVSLYRDDDGIIWVGTYKQGLNYFNENMPAFPLYKHLANNTSSLPFEDVNRFAEDELGNLWIGTNGGGLLYFDRARQSFKQYLAGPGSISNNVIVSLFIDSEKKLWIGSFFGGLDCYDGKRFINYRHDPNQPNSLSENQVWEIFEDRDKQLWIGTINSGLNLFNRETKSFRHIKASQPGTLFSDYISALQNDDAGNLWIGTLEGISIRNREGKFRNFQNEVNNPASLSNNNIISLLNDSRGFMWVGTRDGLNLFDPATNGFRRFFKEQGLTDNTILNILQDDNGHIWISTTNGLSRIQLVNPGLGIGKLGIKVRSYHELNNLQGREFNENAALKTSKGELIFGGPFGFNLFKPAENDTMPGKPGIVFTGFELFNKTIQVGERIGGRVILPEAISRISTITLPFSQNVFSLAFTTLSFPHSGKEQYAYMLEGFNKNWLYTDGQTRSISFTNLDAGDYLLRVKGLNHLGEFSGSEARLSITILPPFWKTTWAYLLYLVLIAVALWLARWQILQRAKMRFALEQERTEARRMHELDVMKIRFITNVSHEFRTPLSLIINPAEKGLKQATDPGQQKQYQLIYRNARRLLNLVNQLLDFRKLEVQEFSLNMQRGDIVSFVKEISNSFLDLAENKHIQFHFSSEMSSLEFDFDADKMEKILFNLLSNAYKFTPDGGKVEVALKVKETHLGALENQQVLEISVKDSGIGIPAENQHRIFDRFFQNELPGNFLNQGSGIGLAIVKEFVNLQKGHILVESKVDEGTCFTLCFPLQAAFENLEGQALTINGLQQLQAPTHALPGLKGKRARILIVEDNEDFRFYLKENLGLHFHVAEAANGKLGWQQVQQWEPDLVVSDIMMPVMNGLELSRKIKADPRTNTIPIILLTAQTAEEQQLEGLQTGANDYISKPFSFEILISRIRNLLRQQKVLKKPVQKITISTTDIEPESAEEKFLLQALEEVERNMANPDFSVEDLSRAMLLSRVGLYKKMVAQTGKTPIEFIRDIRMERAKQMLEKTSRNIAEIAYEVGFNDPKYFAKTFKKCFGVLPSAYTAQKNDLDLDGLSGETEQEGV